MQYYFILINVRIPFQCVGIAQLGEGQTEDLKVTCPIHVHRIVLNWFFVFFIGVGAINYPLRYGSMRGDSSVGRASD